MMYSSLFIVTIVLIKCHVAEDIVTVKAVLGDNAELSCNITSEKIDDKLNILAWYKNGSTTAFYSHDLRKGYNNVMSPSGRYSLVSAEDEGLALLQVSAVTAADGGIYHCLADFASSPALKTYTQLEVIELPQRLWVIHENGTRVATASAGSNTSVDIGAYYINDTVHLFCVVFGGKPQPSILWVTDNQLLKDTSTPLSEQRVRSDLQFGPLSRDHHGHVLTCLARNNEHTPPLFIDVAIDMYLPPQLISVRVTGKETASGGRVKSGKTLALQCRVLGAKPLPSITWQINESQLLELEQNITMEPSQQLIVSDIQLPISPEYDESQVSCCVPAYERDAENIACAVGIPLIVLYAPVLTVVAEGLVNNTLSVIKGSNVSINCSFIANPAVYQLIWFHEDDMVVRNADKAENSIQPSLNLLDVSEKDSGEYVCAASDEEGSSYSDPVVIQVTYPTYCEDETVVEYGVANNECVNLTCKVKGSPEPYAYQWLVRTEFEEDKHNKSTVLETDDSTLMFQRPNGSTAYIACWGINGVAAFQEKPRSCAFVVTDETAPRPPTACVARKNAAREITVTCCEGHDGGMLQKFKFTVHSLDSEEPSMSIISQEAKFMIPEPKQDVYKFVIVAYNEKGSSQSVEIDMDSIIDETIGQLESMSAVTNITTLALALCGGVALLALAACGLVLCAHERTHDAPRPDPPLCAYTTDESNCDTCHDSDDASECNVRRTDSFRRAMTRYPSRGFDVRRTNSFHSARYLQETLEDQPKCREIRHNTACRVHSLQNINRKREMDALCDHLVMHLPPETSYNVPRPMNTFYTMPRKIRHKAREASDEVSEITSDGFSLPPPPDEFGSYRAATRIRDLPATTPTYTTIRKTTPITKDKDSSAILSSMTTVGLPPVSGAHSLYTYSDDEVKNNPFDDNP